MAPGVAVACPHNDSLFPNASWCVGWRVAWGASCRACARKCALLLAPCVSTFATLMVRWLWALAPTTKPKGPHRCCRGGPPRGRKCHGGCCAVFTSQPLHKPHTPPHHATPHYTSPHRTSPHRISPHRTALHRNAHHRTAPHRNTTHRTAPHRTASQPLIKSHTPPHYDTPPRSSPLHTTPHRTAFQRTAPDRTAHRSTPLQTAPRRAASHRTAPHRTAPHRTAPHTTQHMLHGLRPSPPPFVMRVGTIMRLFLVVGTTPTTGPPPRFLLPKLSRLNILTLVSWGPHQCVDVWFVSRASGK